MSICYAMISMANLAMKVYIFEVSWLRCRINIKLNIIFCWSKNSSRSLQRQLFQTFKLVFNLLFASKAGLELLLDRVNDLVEFRIDAVLQEMGRVPLCKLPEDEPLSCEEFLQKTQVIRLKFHKEVFNNFELNCFPFFI